MGQSSSTEQDESPQLREVQSLVASTGALPSLEKAFNLLSDPQTKSIPVSSLQKCFDLTFENLESEQAVMPKEFPLLFSCLGSAIVDLFFEPEKNGVNWIEFLRGYTKCCARMVASTLFNNLFQVFSLTCSKAGIPVNLQFKLYDDDCKISGLLSPRDVLMLLRICWIFAWDSRTSKLNVGKGKGEWNLPDLSHLLSSAIESCAEDVSKLDLWDSDVADIDIQLPAAKIHLWALRTVPNLADCFVQFFHARLCYLATCEDKIEPSCSAAHESSSSATCDTNLLTPGRAWAISLTLRSHMYDEISKICFLIDADDANDSLLYWSSLHGKGLNRFWSNVEGYKGPLLMLIAASEENSPRRWIIGALTHEGFEDKETYYGSSGSLYTLCPVFHELPSFGREKNFVYSHLHPTGRMYDPHPKPEGIAFGGSLGNERIFIDEDFAKVTVRHHAVDKTYQHGALFPNQGYLPVEATVLEVEVWGLGGRSARETQALHQKREQLFTNQRRTVDLKTFSNWEDSPEKMMMDMMTNPSTVRREDR